MQKTDIYRPYFKPAAPEGHFLKVSRMVVLVFAILLIAVALLCNLSQENVLILALKLPGYTLGAILGVLLVAVLTNRGSNFGNILAMLSSVLFVIALSYFELVSFGWFVVFGTLWTYTVACLFSPQKIRT